ncbi:CPBP family intramembrane glutamic endopeptidase [Flavobacterium macacae]|uniref:CPBP family intramembrane metalloprotease n=1 Tax=Flavobacterium macacae TaxID=2488993 RepID=A0A3P3WH57_9FLAO|nr:type II CAAX endopeptidase family protein [Flavobacterium macacae]RRJ93496.1 CPBP family intramembrane metalloprotease [Flavobacterium macacae]
MFIEQGFKPNDNRFWKYIVGSIAVIGASVIGQIPFGIAIAVKAAMNNMPMPTGTEMMTILESNLTLFLMLISFPVALLGLYLIVKFFHRQSFLQITTSRNKIDWSRVFFAFGIWAVISIASVGIDYIANPENYELNFKAVPFLILAVIAIILIPLQTSTEEYVFRGYLMQGFGVLAKNRWFPLLMTSVIFGSMHIFNPEVQKLGNIILVYYIGTGLFLAIITLMDEGMELALGFHAANNLITALLVTTDWTVFQTHSVLKDISEPSVGLTIFIPVFIVFPILLLIFAKKYKWTNWKEKLTGRIIFEEKN